MDIDIVTTNHVSPYKPEMLPWQRTTSISTRQCVCILLFAEPLAEVPKGLGRILFVGRGEKVGKISKILLHIGHNPWIYSQDV